MPQVCSNGASRALLVSPDPRTAAEFKSLLGRELPQTALVVSDSYPDRIQLSEYAAKGMQLCFLAVGPDVATAFNTMALAASACPEVPVLALLPSNDPDLILQCLRQGATEFLIQPFTADQLRAAYAKLSRFRPVSGGEQESGGKVYCVMPGKGACGATTVACSLAFALKRQGAGRILLADMDGFTGTMAFLMKLKSNYSFLDALSHAGNLDADVWKALVTPYHDVDVLLSPENPVDSMAETSDPHPIIGYARRMYDAVVLDAGGAYGDWNLALARFCDDLLLVGTNELAAIHALQRATAYLDRNGVHKQKRRIVINRYAQVSGLLPRESIEAAVQSPVFDTLPSDYETIQRSLMEGKPAPAASRFGKGVDHMAQQLAGHSGKSNGNGNGKSSMFSGFLKRITG